LLTTDIFTKPIDIFVSDNFRKSYNISSAPYLKVEFRGLARREQIVTMVQYLFELSACSFWFFDWTLQVFYFTQQTLDASLIW